MNTYMKYGTITKWRVASALFFIQTMVFSLLLSAVALNAQDADRAQRKQSEIKLIEDLLTSYLDVYDLPWKMNEKIYGVELADWGVVFFVPVQVNPQRIIGRNFNFDIPAEDMQPVNEDSLLQKFQNDLIGFLSNYTHVLTELKPRDRIMIVIDEGSSAGIDRLMVYFSKAKNRLLSVPEADGESGIVNPRFSLCTTKESLDNYRTGDITLSELRKGVEISRQFNDLEKSNAEFYRSMKTMETAYKSRLQNGNDRNYRDVGVQSMYLPQYGVIFIVESRGFPFVMNIAGLDSVTMKLSKGLLDNSQEIIVDIKKQLKKNPYAAPFFSGGESDSAEAKVVVPSKPHAPSAGGTVYGHFPPFPPAMRNADDVKAEYEAFKMNLLTTTMQFGHTLDLLKDDNCVTVVSLMKNMFDGRGSGSKFQIVARVGDIRRFFRGSLTMDELKDKIVVKEYN